MKTVTVTCQIMLEVDDSNGEIKDEVIDQLELINTIVGMSELHSAPKILTSSIDSSDIN